MRAADLLTILTKSPKKTEYQGVESVKYFV